MTDSIPRHRRVDLTHINGLDGLRGLAVIAVVLYHGDLSWSTGGFLGVELFFVLSGFLITSLLVREWLGSGRIVLSNFWARRARRLLPALFVLVTVIGIYYACKGTVGSVPGLFGDGLSTLFYYSNWHQIAVGANYFVQTGPTSPFQHTWSLAIEEQFYVIWPLLFLTLAWGVRRLIRARPGAPSEREAARLLNALLAISLLLLVGSAVDALVLYHGGSGQNRVYMGTDTRAYGLLSGAILAIFMARLRLSGRGAAGSLETGATVVEAESPRARSRFAVGARITPLISVASALVVAGLLILMYGVDGSDHWLYPWGFLLCDALGVTLIAVIVTTPRSIANRIFSLAPLRWMGNISYGLYLWHFPMFLWLDQTTVGVKGSALFGVRVIASLAVAVLSYHLVEQPVRQRRWPIWIIRGLAPITAGAGVISLSLATSAAAIPTAVPPPAPTVTTHLAGNDPTCKVALSNSRLVGTVAPKRSVEEKFEFQGLDRGTATWPSARTTKRFTTCPPKRALVIGDSIAFSLGLPMLYDEQRYGTAVADAAILGCAFGTRGTLEVNGKWISLPRGCPNEINTWAAQAKQFGANEIIFEIGYRDEFNFKWNGKIVHLGQTAFDNYVYSRIKEFIKVLGENGKRKLLFLSVPYVDPPAAPDGSDAPQGSTVRHNEINALIRKAAATDGANASVLDIDKTLSPHGTFAQTVNGQQCRLGDGIHPSIYCGELVEPTIFKAGRALLDK